MSFTIIIIIMADTMWDNTIAVTHISGFRSNISRMKLKLKEAYTYSRVSLSWGPV